MKTITKLSICLFFALIVYGTPCNAITVVSAASGNWANTSTWNPACIPGCGDSIVIQAAHTISVTTQQNYEKCSQPLRIIVHGTLKFFNGSKLNLPCGSYMIVYPGGMVTADVGLQNSNFIEICGNVEWNSNAPLYGLACLPPTHPICATVLPVELAGFNATNCGNSICLDWLTFSERNNNYFEIQRSTDGVFFNGILKYNSLAASGNSNSKLYYQITDASPVNGTNYYRLKQVDLDGSYSYSKILAIQSDIRKGKGVVIYPNVNSGEFSARLNEMSSSGDVTVLLRDASGQIVYKAWQYVNAPEEPIRISPKQKLANGVYYCSFIVGGDEYIVKVVVTHS